MLQRHGIRSLAITELFRAIDFLVENGALSRPSDMARLLVRIGEQDDDESSPDLNRLELWQRFLGLISRQLADFRQAIKDKILRRVIIDRVRLRRTS